MDKIAIYPGTFDPLTNGHLDVIKRASRLFDKLIVAVACNERKTPLFTVEQRMAMIRQAVKGLPGVTVDSFSDLLVGYAKRKQVTAVIRGLRVISDFEYEFQMALMNRKLSPAMETVFLMPSEQYTYLNSGLVREIARLGGDIRALVPANVAKQLKEMFPR